jgi:hypothetical protein
MLTKNGHYITTHKNKVTKKEIEQRAQELGGWDITAAEYIVNDIQERALKSKKVKEKFGCTG